MSGPLQDEQLQVLPAQSVPQTLLAATAPDAKRRARPKTPSADDIPYKRNRALKAHLTETELELAKTRVNSKNETIHAVVDAEYVRIGASGENISPKWWEKTLEAFNFGQGVENQLKDDGDPNQPVDPDLVNAIKECYHSNPAKRKCNMFKNYLAQVEDIPRKEELAWAIARPKSKAKGKTLDEVKTLHHPYDLALTQVETTNLAKYEADLPRGISCNIVQSFDKRPTYGTVDTMHTIVANMGLHFCTSSSVRRWFTTSELMVAQGIPIHRSFANPRGRHYTTTPYLMPANRKRIKVLHQIGNTMQIPVVGTVLFYLILFTQW